MPGPLQGSSCGRRSGTPARESMACATQSRPSPSACLRRGGPGSQSRPPVGGRPPPADAERPSEAPGHSGSGVARPGHPAGEVARQRPRCVVKLREELRAWHCPARPGGPPVVVQRRRVPAPPGKPRRHGNACVPPARVRRGERADAQAPPVAQPSEPVVATSEGDERRAGPRGRRVPTEDCQADRAIAEALRGPQYPPQGQAVSVGDVDVELLRQPRGKEPQRRPETDARGSEGGAAAPVRARFTATGERAHGRQGGAFAAHPQEDASAGLRFRLNSRADWGTYVT